MIQFTYKLKLNERVKAKCKRHPRCNPEKHAIAGIRGGCSACWDLYHLHQSRVALDRAARDFLRHAAPWIKFRRPRDPRTEEADQIEEPPSNEPPRKTAIFERPGCSPRIDRQRTLPTLRLISSIEQRRWMRTKDAEPGSGLRHLKACHSHLRRGRKGTLTVCTDPSSTPR